MAQLRCAVYLLYAVNQDLMKMNFFNKFNSYTVDLYPHAMPPLLY